MEFQKIASFLDKISDDKDLPRFVTKKWIEVDDQSGRNCNINKKIRMQASILRSDLCNYSDAYIVVKGTITIVRPDGAKRTKEVVFRDNAPFINCISKINGVRIDNAEGLDVVMPMYNLLEYSKNYRKTTGRLWNYYRDKLSNLLSSESSESSNSESFKYNTRNTYNAGAGEDGYDAHKVGKNNTEVVIPPKHLSNFWRSLNIPLIKEVEVF